MVRRCWVNFQRRGVLFIWIIVGQGPVALAVGAGGVVWTFFLSSSSFLSPSQGDGRIKTEILSQTTVKPETANRPTKSCACFTKQANELKRDFDQLKVGS